MTVPFVRLDEIPARGHGDGPHHGPDHAPRDEASLLAALGRVGHPVVAGLVWRAAESPSAEPSAASGVPASSEEDDRARAILDRLGSSDRTDASDVFVVTDLGEPGSPPRVGDAAVVLTFLRRLPPGARALVRPLPAAAASGHVNSSDPVSGDPEVVVTAAWGVHALSGGSEAAGDDAASPASERPDVVVVDGDDRVVQRVTRPKHVAVHAVDGVLAVRDVNVFRRASEVVDDARAVELARRVRAAAVALGGPVRLAWAVVDGELLVVGARLLDVDH